MSSYHGSLHTMHSSFWKTASLFPTFCISSALLLALATLSFSHLMNSNIPSPKPSQHRARWPCKPAGLFAGSLWRYRNHQSDINRFISLYIFKAELCWAWGFTLTRPPPTFTFSWSSWSCFLQLEGLQQYWCTPIIYSSERLVCGCISKYSAVTPQILRWCSGWGKASG